MFKPSWMYIQHRTNGRLWTDVDWAAAGTPEPPRVSYLARGPGRHSSTQWNPLLHLVHTVLWQTRGPTSVVPNPSLQHSKDLTRHFLRGLPHIAKVRASNPTITGISSTPPPLTGTFQFELSRGTAETPRLLLELSGGLHFRNLKISCELDGCFRRMVEVVAVCSSTLECLKITCTIVDGIVDSVPSSSRKLI